MLDTTQILHDWKTLSPVNGDQLIDARKQVHWAAQILSASADAILPHEKDDSQSNLGWDGTTGRLLSQWLNSDLQLGLDIANPGIHIHSKGERSGDVIQLDGQTLSQVQGRVEQTLLPRLDNESFSIRIRDYDMPDHPVSSGAAFNFIHPQSLDLISKWLHNGFLILNAVKEDRVEKSEVRCWPHHFDVGLLLDLSHTQDAIEGATIGLGLSLGDGYYSTPYWYMNPYPQPDDTKGLTPLDAGIWHHQDWFGAVLKAGEVESLKSSEAQIELLSRFLKSAIKAIKGLLT